MARLTKELSPFLGSFSLLGSGSGFVSSYMTRDMSAIQTISVREINPSILTLLALLPDPNVPMTITIKNIPSVKEFILQLQETKSIHNGLV